MKTNTTDAEKTTQARVTLTPAELDAMMPPGDYVHTFRQAGNVLVGTDWERSKLLEAATAHGAELSGDTATAMQHGAVIAKLGLFIETIPTAQPSP